MRSLVVVLVLAVVLTGCSGDDGATGDSSGSGGTEGERIQIDGASALTWGDGDYGVVLAHGAAFDAASWQDQADVIADQGATVVAVEDITPEAIEAAVTVLRDDGVTDVALVGGSAGADAILRLVAQSPGLADQLVLLSPNSVVEGLGEEPQLFIASADEPGAEVPQELADVSTSDDVVVELLPGSAHAQNIFDSEQGDEALDLLVERLRR